MSKHEDRLDKLEAAQETVASSVMEELERQAKYVASNMYLMYGGKAIADPSGFVHSIIGAHAACLFWAIAEGYVRVTAKGKATAEDIEERAAIKAEIEAAGGHRQRPESAGSAMNPGAYI